MAPKWFPDSRRIAFLSRVWPDAKSWAEQRTRMEDHAARKMTAQVWDKAPISYWDHFLDERRTHVYAVSLDGSEPQAITLGRTLPLDAAEPDTSSYDIAPDGAEIAFAADTDASGIDPNFDVFVMPLEGGEPRSLTSGQSRANDSSPPLTAPTDASLALRRQTLKDFYADRARLLIFDRRNSQTRVLTEDWDRSADGLVWSPDSSALFGSIEDAGTLRITLSLLCAAAAPAADHARKEASAHSASRGQAAPSSSACARASPGAADTRQHHSAHRSGRSHEADRLQRLTAIASATTGRVERHVHRRGRREHVQMWVAYPLESFTPDRKWPLFMFAHGGPHNAVQRHLAMALERAGVRELGLRDGVAQLPRLERLRSGVRGFDHEGMGGAAVSGHDRARGSGFAAQPWIDNVRTVGGAAAATADISRPCCSDASIRSRRSSRTQRFTTSGHCSTRPTTARSKASPANSKGTSRSASIAPSRRT